MLWYTRSLHCRSRAVGVVLYRMCRAVLPPRLWYMTPQESPTSCLVAVAAGAVTSRGMCPWSVLLLDRIMGALLCTTLTCRVMSCVFLCVRQSFGEDILASLRELEDALRDAGPVERPEGQKPSSSLHQECLYYLNTYGTHLALINFYIRHECMTEALTHLLNKVRLSELPQLPVGLSGSDLVVKGHCDPTKLPVNS